MSPKYSDDVERTFENLKKPDFDMVRKSLEKRDTPYIVNPMTFEMRVSKIYYNIITGYGWTVADYEYALNYDKWHTK